jgi:hypothetical protein
MKPIASAADLDEARSQPRAIVFIYVSWAIQARRSETACNEFLETLRREYPNEEIPIYRVDLTEQNGEVWDSVRNWLRKETWQESSLTYGGYGAMLWLRRGKVAVSKPYFASVGLDRAMAITREAFVLDDETDGSGSAKAGFVGWVSTHLSLTRPSMRKRSDDVK